MMSGRIYSIDSSALIHAWRRAYRPANFPSFWNWMDTLIAARRLRASIEVFHEMAKKDDDIHAWCKERKHLLFEDLDGATQAAVVRIMNAYPRLVDTARGRSGGDPFVIALAIAAKPAMTVITEEHPGKTKIPDVCLAEAVECVNLVDMIELEGWVA